MYHRNLLQKRRNKSYLRAYFTWSNVVNSCTAIQSLNRFKSNLSLFTIAVCFTR